jgi:hypothetical protein
MAHRVSKYVALACSAVTVASMIACDSGTRGQYTAGLTSLPSAAFSLRMTPPNVTLIALSRAGCPAIQPFTTNFSLVVGPSASDFFIDRISLRFGDPFGRTSTVLFANDQLALLFGDTRVRTGTNRTFALRPQFGCGLSQPRSIDAIIDLVDVVGVTHQASATAMFQ